MAVARFLSRVASVDHWSVHFGRPAMAAINGMLKSYPYLRFTC